MSQTPGKLERRARALLRVYPAEYRHGRAEEIIGTLLEAASPGRSWPTAREAWSLIAGGRHARAVRNRQPGVKASLRLALLLGISTCISFAVTDGDFRMGIFPGDGRSWLAYTTGALCLAVALAPWLGSRATTAALAVPAGALMAYGEWGPAHQHSALAEFLIMMAALAALSGGPVRLRRAWLLLPCAFPLALAAELLLPHPPLLLSGLRTSRLLDVLVLLAVVVVCWLLTDPRPAFALCLTVLLEGAMIVTPGLLFGGPLPLFQSVELFLVLCAIVVPVMLPASWLLLRRQKASSSFSES